MHDAGISWKDKITALRGKMAERKAPWFVVTALDEVACEYKYPVSFSIVQFHVGYLLRNLYAAGNEKPCSIPRGQ